VTRAALRRDWRPKPASPDPQLHTVIRPPGRWPRAELGELWRFRAICLVLARRALMVRYRQTVVGVGWALIQPLLLMAVFTVFFGILGKFPSEGVPYPVFVYTGLLIWQMVNKTFTEGTNSLISNAEMVRKIYFPRAYFPIAVALSSLVDVVFGLVALCVLLVIYTIVPGPQLLLLPIPAGIALMSALGLAFWSSALNVSYRDVGHLLPFLAQVWMFLTPIIYPSTIVPDAYRPLLYLNPLTVAVEGVRWSILGSPAPALSAWLIGSTVAVLFLVSGYLFFRSQEPKFADVV
jgi:lipopolysaccharide transport system permease protein